ncbi:gamma-glutamylcyclotransferase family protein [Nitratireductor kimnyeongensis]|uniref:Gamma-glutamylcyclotransferase family protein n=1 Tax=Nitratireductor kimnyeongensis TaxID=430679 RepID=A0ABW0T9T0_9HYPH|nr:gamma-glutamylcyclotransferase family protein [Nitratireductor kimnyeongensis]QZZ35689.1 gamma-glutamylcyclotransferase [Nitratireductor kimnyeongensis]
MGAGDIPGDLVGYFGYGSLVNRDTHRTEIVDALPARLRGWRRHWVRRDGESNRALLSVRREPGAVVDGLLVLDRAENLPAVDLREERYKRVSITADELELSGAVPAGCALYVYEACVFDGAEPLEIIQSYLDAVLQGFLREHGRDGVERFVHETDGFDLAVIADRKAPTYPRAVTLRHEEEVYFDALLMQKIPDFASFVR